MRTERNAKKTSSEVPVSTPELEAKAQETMCDVRTLVQACKLLGYRVFYDPAIISDKTLELAIDVLSTESKHRKEFGVTEFCKARVEFLQRHYERNRRIIGSVIYDDDEEDVTLPDDLTQAAYEEHERQMATLNYALRPRDGVSLLQAELEGRKGTLDIESLPFLRHPAEEIETRPLDDGPLPEEPFSDEDYSQFFGSKKGTQ